jgi:3-oxoisoapionate decarboxylase
MATRREVLIGATTLAASMAMPAAAAVERPKSPPKSPMGVAQTAIGHYLRHLRGEIRTNPIDPVTVVDYVRALGGGGIQLVVPLDANLKRLRSTLERNEMFFEGDIRMIEKPDDDTSAFEQGLRNYKELGASCVRTVSFEGRRYVTFKTLDEYKAWLASSNAILEKCVPIAERVGIPLAIENHKDRVVDQEVDVLKRFSSEYLGALIDFGNNIAMCDDPTDVVEKLAPYVKSCHMKNMGVAPYRDGFLLSEVLFEDGFMDIPSLFALLKKSNPKLNPMHELITRDPLPVPVLTDQYWVTWPDRGGEYLARTLRLVTANASQKPLPIVSNLDPAAQLAVEESNNIDCFNWARKALGSA